MSDAMRRVLWSGLRPNQLTGVFDVRRIGRQRGIHFVLALLARHQSQVSRSMCGGCLSPKGTMDLLKKVVFFTRFELLADLESINPKVACAGSSNRVT
jgi:hypothetical protein